METSSGLIHSVDYGGSGDLFVLAHGLGGSIANWDAIAPSLTELGHVVALDLPGFGLSPPGPDWSLTGHAKALHSFVTEWGPSATVVGNSMGGLLAEMVAAEHPELVERLLLVSPATPPRLPDPRIHWPTARRLLLQAIPGVGKSMARYMLRRLTPEEIVRLALENITHNPGRVPLDVVEEFIELARIRKELPWAEEAIPGTGTSIALMFRKPSQFVAMIREIRAPTMVVQGLDDHIVSPTSVEWMCSLRPDWELEQMEDTGHTPQLDAPQRLLGVIMPWLRAGAKHEHTA